MIMEDITSILVGHTEVKRSFLDKLLGQNKEIDTIVKVRSQIKALQNKFSEFEKTAFLPTGGFIKTPKSDFNFRRYFTLLSNITIDERRYYKEFGPATLLYKLITTRNDLIDLLDGYIDISDIKKEIRDEKLKSLGI